VFRDIPVRGAEFPPRLWAAIRQSRALVPLISPHVMIRDERENWVRREIEAHKHYFDERRIYPVILSGGRHEQIVAGFRPIEVGNDEAAAIQELVRELKSLREGREDPPCSYRPKGDPHTELS
jgi:hypothetical protein